MRMETLDDLFLEQLRELYGAEQQLVKALAEMAANAASENLRQAFRQHREQTLEHVHRLEQCFRELGKYGGAETVHAMEGLIQDGERAVQAIVLSPLRDAALIGVARRIEHHEIAAYSGTLSLARLFGWERIAGLLEQTLQEEEKTDATLTQIADTVVNQEALQLGAHQEA